jgi:hypothetical protein
MDAKKIIEKDLLMRKIYEYFSKHPKSKSVIIRANIMGSGKTSWKVVREGKRFNVTEVRTSKAKFFVEAPVGGQAPAQGSQPPLGMQNQTPKNSVQAKQANIQQFAQLDLPTKLAQLSTGMMLNYDTAINTLAQIVKEKSQDLVQFRRALESGINAAPLDANQKRLVSNILGILTSISNESTLMSSKQIKGKPLLKEEEEDSKKKDQQVEDPDASNPSETSLETGSEEDQASDSPTLPKFRSEEQMVLTKSLTGQTIKAADIDLRPEGGILSLDLVSTETPAQLKWFNNGKVVYVYKGRPYLIKKDI